VTRTLLKKSSTLDESITQEIRVPNSNIIAYITRVAVELRQDEHELQAEQHAPHAALPQQAAS